MLKVKITEKHLGLCIIQNAIFAKLSQNFLKRIDQKKGIENYDIFLIEKTVEISLQKNFKGY
ncbi:hypothetical protein [Borreliella valaisiana]|uniref:hypothetical protein n=1 Tax=Borreliella valaisiana TaxID=62088 RepID=UPI003B2274FE